MLEPDKSILGSDRKQDYRSLDWTNHRTIGYYLAASQRHVKVCKTFIRRFDPAPRLQQNTPYLITVLYGIQRLFAAVVQLGQVPAGLLSFP